MIVDSKLTLDRDELTRKQWENLFVKLTFNDKDGIECAAYDYVSSKRIVRIPRGAWNLIPAKVDVIDNRTLPAAPKMRYAKKLDSADYAGQEEAVAAMFEHQQGQIIAPPGRGKTEIAYAFMAAAKTRSLVVVHTHDLFKQWTERADSSVPGVHVGTIAGKRFDIGHITVATAQTLKRHVRKGDKFWGQFGCIVVDEAHHAAAETWEWLLNVCPAHYRFGMTASEKRSDGRQPLVKFNIGPVIYRMKFKSPVPVTVIPVSSGHRARYSAIQYSKLVKDVVNDPDRNKTIALLAGRQVAKGRYVLVLSRQIGHLELIGQAMSSYAFSHTALVTGKLTKTLRAKYRKQMIDGELHCILGTQLFEEGVDIPRLDCIILAFPGTPITLIQKIGRGARTFEDKTDLLVYDIVDDYVPKFIDHWLDRKSWYKQNGVTIGKAVQHGDKGKGKRKERKSGADLIRSLKVKRS